MTPTDQHIHLATWLISEAALHDRWLIHPDPHTRQRTTAAWAEALADHHFPTPNTTNPHAALATAQHDLTAGIKATYLTSSDLPRNPLGAILTNARQARQTRLARTQTQAAIAERKTPELPPIRAAYAVDAANTIPCPTCGAAAEEWCTNREGNPRTIPCPERLGVAFERHNPVGIRKRAERAAQLEVHRRTFKPKWLRTQGKRAKSR